MGGVKARSFGGSGSSSLSVSPYPWLFTSPQMAAVRKVERIVKTEKMTGIERE